MTIVQFVPRMAEGREFECMICHVPIWTAISLDHFPICSMCRWFCSAEGRWGRKNDGIAVSGMRK